MRLPIIFVLCFFVSESQLWNQQIQPDCDGEFAQMAIGLVQTKIEDPEKLQNIQAILSSCNKAIVQKMTEVSVFLLRKGILPSKLLEEVKDVAETIRSQKDKHMENLIQQADRSLRKPLSEIAAINRNKSLSGNEKVQATDVVLRSLELPARNMVIQILSNQEVLVPTPNSLPILNGSPIEPSNKLIRKSRPTEKPGKPVEELVTTPASFKIEQEVPDNRAGPFQPTKIEPSALNPVGVGFPHAPPQHSILFEKKESEVPLIRPKLPTIERKQDVGDKLFSSLPSANKVVQPEPSPMQNSLFGESIAPSIFNQGRPHTVGKVESEEVIPNIDDADLLKTRPSLWRDAVKFLEQSTNIPQEIKKMLEGNMLRNGVVKEGNTWNQSPFAANSFPLPKEAYDALKKQIEAIPRIQSRSPSSSFLPSRDDPIVPVNSGALERYDTNLGRFAANGQTNKFTLSGAPLLSLPPLGVSGMQSQGQGSAANQGGASPVHVEQESNPGYANRRPNIRPQIPLAPGIVNFNLKPKVTAPAPVEVKNINTDDSFAYGNRQETIIEDRPSINTQVDQMIKPDSSSQLSRGQQNIQYPIYPPAPSKWETPKPMQVDGPIPLSGRNAETKFPDFPSIGAGSGIPEYQPYIGPEEITGSRLQAQERYNLRQNGQNKFVKIDLSNN